MSLTLLRVSIGVCFGNSGVAPNNDDISELGLNVTVKSVTVSLCKCVNIEKCFALYLFYRYLE
jgi:hypothetical protein